MITVKYTICVEVCEYLMTYMLDCMLCYLSIRCRYTMQIPDRALLTSWAKGKSALQEVKGAVIDLTIKGSIPDWSQQDSLAVQMVSVFMKSSVSGRRQPECA
ncbi:unnamed protein product [Nippostrongylus brasiliensis]|uniref:M protein n=1 Tax=Nippostrongylus brasiliensis TaxID=27835 RepID=A0A0N4XI54_NIPBR|nr:unnamed protein product [Nippostrongylus brasiliensis]